MKLQTALLDANVLYPAPLRDLLLQLAAINLFRARWSAHIHGEWIASLLEREPHRNRVSLERTRRLMDEAISDSLVTGYERLIAKLRLPDPDDRHVLAAAMRGACDTIVSFNLRDFPASALKPHRVLAIHPDVFLAEKLGSDPERFTFAIRRIRARLRSPPMSVLQYLAVLTRQGLPQTTAMLRLRVREL